MNKEFERYHKKVEIPISVIIETIFNSDNHDVETLCRYAKEYGYVDLIKEDGKKLGYYKLQDDYTKQSFYTYLSKTERKQYDYENYLCDEVEKKDKEIYRLNNIRVKALKFIYKKLIPENVDWDYDDCIFSDLPAAAIKPLVDILELKEEGNK